MAITAKRETVAAYLKSTTLPLINGVGNYNLKVTKIDRKYTLPINMDSGCFPYIQIIEDLEIPYTFNTARELITGHTIANQADGQPVAIIGWVQSSDPETLVTKMNKMHSDILIAMSSDRSLGGNVSYAGLVTTQNSLAYANKTLGAVVTIWSLKYCINPSASTPVT